jgi:hypothetical protein
MLKARAEGNETMATHKSNRVPAMIGAYGGIRSSASRHVAWELSQAIFFVRAGLVGYAADWAWSRYKNPVTEGT